MSFDDLEGGSKWVSRFLELNKPWEESYKSRSTYHASGRVKDVVRRCVYAHVADLLRERPSPPYRVLMLAGREPELEVGVARETFGTEATVVAMDLDPVAVERAKKCASIAVHMDVGSLRLKGPNQAPHKLITPYDFANMDFCGHVTSNGVASAVERATRLATYTATWFSYGRETEKPGRRAGLDELRRRAKSFVEGATPAIWDDVPDVIRDRALYIALRARESAPGYYQGGPVVHAVKVWSYVDKVMPMFCVLWGPYQYTHQPIAFEKVTSSTVAPAILPLPSPPPPKALPVYLRGDTPSEVMPSRTSRSASPVVVCARGGNCTHPWEWRSRLRCPH